jgi:hypothetical protein
MSIGPVELLVINFPGNQFKGEIVPALKELIENNTIRIIDILFVQKDTAGNVAILEISELSDEAYDVFEPLVSDVSGIASESDALHFAAVLENNSSAAMMLFENVWATRFRDAIVNANGQLLLSERIPKAVIDSLMAEKLQATAPV